MEIEPGSIPFDGACYFTCVNEGLNIARWRPDTGLGVEEEEERGRPASFLRTAWRETLQPAGMLAPRPRSTI